MLDLTKPYVHHMNEETGRTFEQDGVFYTTQGEPLNAAPTPKSEKPAANEPIPDGFKKGRFGRLEPIA